MTAEPEHDARLTLTRVPRSWQVHAASRLDPAAIDETVATIAANDGGPVYLWVSQPTEDDDAIAESAGFTLGRDLCQLRVALPLAGAHWDATVPTRAFRPGVDDAAWLVVNNRAFAWHPEQGGWTQSQLTARLAEPWFDAEGFRLHERDGRLAAFCWTKVHEPDADDAGRLGEIFVIAVDPDFTGLGLGRSLTVAGLRWLHDVRGIDTGMLYVDAANAPAVGLYEKLGFTRHHVDRAYHRVVDAVSRR
jgi:mycothiol synthase